MYSILPRLHEVDMAEGDIIYYESARCLHGRMQPLEGAHYVNLFAHYRPLGDPAWFEKANPEDSPEQLIDIGECRTDGQQVACSKVDDGQLPFLSPKMETVRVLPQILLGAIPPTQPLLSLPMLPPLLPPHILLLSSPLLPHTTPHNMNYYLNS